MNTTQKTDNFVELCTDAEHILHRIGSEDYPTIRRIMVKATDAANYEEVSVADIPAYTKAEYDAEVERLIAERYSHGKEIEVNREHDTKPEQFAAYMAYIEECKAKAVANLTAKNESKELLTAAANDTNKG